MRYAIAAATMFALVAGIVLRFVVSRGLDGSASVAPKAQAVEEQNQDPSLRHGLVTAWRRFWSLSWWWKGPAVGTVGLLGLLAAVAVVVASGGGNDTAVSGVVEAPTSTTSFAPTPTSTPTPIPPTPTPEPATPTPVPQPIPEQPIPTPESPPPTATPQPQLFTTACGGPAHLVQPGHTLFAIARRWGVSVESIVQANQIADPNSLLVGQLLCIPSG